MLRVVFWLFLNLFLALGAAAQQTTVQHDDTEAQHDVLVRGSSDWLLTAMPDCDADGKKLEYDTGTNAFACNNFGDWVDSGTATDGCGGGSCTTWYGTTNLNYLDLGTLTCVQYSNTGAGGLDANGTYLELALPAAHASFTGTRYSMGSAVIYEGSSEINGIYFIQDAWTTVRIYKETFVTLSSATSWGVYVSFCYPTA